jgi:two-component system sensor histidine kinase DegS
LIDITNLDLVIRKTIQAVEKSKEELYQIGENARREYERVKKELLAVKEMTTVVVQKVDVLEKQYNKARIRLMEVNRDFKKYTEDEIKDAYDKAYNKQIELFSEREKEKLLRFQRDQLERSMKTLDDTVHRSEELISNVGMALKLLTNDLESISGQIGELQQRQALGISIIKAQEEERKRVARDIHDGPAQSMANIVMRAEFCLKLMEKNPSAVTDELNSLIELVRTSLNEVRKIIFDLRPMVLDDLGLVPALKRYVEQYIEENGIFVEMIVFGRECRLDNSLEVTLFRVVQESLTNIKKHADARDVVVKVEFTQNAVSVLIRDNGCGFDKDTVMAKRGRQGYGLIGMKERIELIGGRLDVRTAIDRGTEVFLSVPTKV